MKGTALALATLTAVTVLGTAAARPADRRVGTAGVTIALPAGWNDWEPPRGLVGPVTDPLTRVVAVSAAFHFAATGCQVAAYAFPRAAVAVVVVEWIRLGRGAHWSPRPPSFSPSALPLQPPPAIECFHGAGGSVEFAERGRHLGAYLLVGRDAEPRLVARARRVLDTLRVAGR